MYCACMLETLVDRITRLKSKSYACDTVWIKIKTCGTSSILWVCTIWNLHKFRQDDTKADWLRALPFKNRWGGCGLDGSKGWT